MDSWVKREDYNRELTPNLAKLLIGLSEACTGISVEVIKCGSKSVRVTIDCCDCCGGKKRPCCDVFYLLDLSSPETPLEDGAIQIINEEQDRKLFDSLEKILLKKVPEIIPEYGIYIFGRDCEGDVLPIIVKVSGVKNAFCAMSRLKQEEKEKKIKKWNESKDDLDIMIKIYQRMGSS